MFWRKKKMNGYEAQMAAWNKKIDEATHHVHAPDHNYPATWRTKKINRSLYSSFSTQYLVAERVCLTCKAKYVHEIEVEGYLLAYIRSKPKAAKELDLLD